MKRKQEKKELSEKNKIFAVKTHYLIKTIGRAFNIDKFYNKDVAMYEERVVLILAKDFDTAIIKAEKEAKKYANYEYTNIYSQKVVTKYLNCCDAFEVYDSLDEGCEVFSSTHLYKKKINRKKMLDEKVGEMSSVSEKKYRKKFYGK